MTLARFESLHLKNAVAPSPDAGEGCADPRWLRLLGRGKGMTKSASVSSTYDYDVYGRVARSTENVAINYKFTGQELDGMSGLYNFRARLYDTDLGMFYATDPANSSTSPYGYVSDNPVSRIDPSGRVDQNYQSDDEKINQWGEMNRIYGPKDPKTVIDEDIAIWGSLDGIAQNQGSEGLFYSTLSLRETN